MRKTFWVAEYIEENLTGKYWTGYNQHMIDDEPGHCDKLFTSDINKARKFDTKEEAEMILEMWCLQCEATEHEFVDFKPEKQ